jgi:hypothetical protein
MDVGMQVRISRWASSLRQAPLASESEWTRLVRQVKSSRERLQTRAERRFFSCPFCLGTVPSTITPPRAEAQGRVEAARMLPLLSASSGARTSTSTADQHASARDIVERYKQSHPGHNAAKDKNRSLDVSQAWRGPDASRATRTRCTRRDPWWGRGRHFCRGPLRSLRQPLRAIPSHPILHPRVRLPTT